MAVIAIQSSLTIEALCELLSRQVNSLWIDAEPVVEDVLLPFARRALERLEHCFSKVDNRYFFDGKQALFDHLHGDQYAMWLYLMSNQLYKDGAPSSWPKKVFLLNKALHGCDIFYEVELPSVFLLVHPLGTVLGRGSYNDYFLAYQRCGVGSNHGVYPRLGAHVTLRPGSSVLGKSVVGDNVTLAAEALAIDTAIASNTTYFGNPRKYWTRPRGSLEQIWRT